jgi:hypothetical protein
MNQSKPDSRRCGKDAPPVEITPLPVLVRPEQREIRLAKKGCERRVIVPVKSKLVSPGGREQEVVLFEVRRISCLTDDNGCGKKEGNNKRECQSHGVLRENVLGASCGATLAERVSAFL